MIKKALKIGIPLVLVVCIVLGIMVVSAAGVSVIYDGKAKEIVFENASPFGKNEQPDLFTNLKGLMPGDTASQEITIGARDLGYDSVKIYLRAENPNDDWKKLVDEGGRWVKFTVKNGDQEITGDLEKGVLLGTFDNSGKATVTVDLTIDILADNTLQALVAEIDWVFTAEVIPGVIPTPNVPGGDVPALIDFHANYIVGYPDGSVRPDNSITRAEVATIFYRLLTDDAREAICSHENNYSDVSGKDWFNVAVSTLTNGGYLTGYPDGTFRPNEPITRAELATIICRFDKQFGEMEVTKGFADAEGHWAEEYITFSATRGYVVGYPDGNFCPDKEITRAETVAMINRLLKRAVDEEGMMEGHVEWTDNYPGTWSYFEMQEAGDNHDFKRSERQVDGQDFFYENWTEIYDPVDWAAKEQEWIKLFG